jgi:outer membrane protein assembly factor BamD
MKKKRFNPKAFLSLFLLLFILLLFGCGGKKAKGLKIAEGDPEVLYKQGLVLFNKKAYKGAAEKFEQIKSNFPDSPPFTIWAELRVADSHFYSKSYVEAVIGYEEFRKIHPTYEEMPYVQYQIGMCYFKQMTTADRDQTFTQKALSNFEYLIANYPPNLFTEKAKEKIGDCRRQLAGHEFFIGDFYYRQGKFEPAAKRFEELLGKYPKWLDQDKTLFFLGKSYIELNQGEKARETFTRLITEYPKSAPAKEAKKILARGLIEKKVVSQKGKAVSKKPKGKIPEPEPEGLVLVKYEEEGKRAVSLTEERRPDAKKGEEKIALPPVTMEEARPIPSPLPPRSPLPVTEKATEPIPSGEETEKTEMLPPSPIGEEKAKPIPALPSEELNVAPIPGEEPLKSLPTKVESRLENRSEEGKPKAVLPGILGPLVEGGKPKKEAEAGPLQVAKLTDTAHPIDISSDSVETLTKENLILFKGNVVARQRDIVIYADSLEAVVLDDGKGIEKVIAGGNVKIQQGLRVANCQKAIFYNLDKKVVLTGDPKVWEGDNSVSGEEIVFDIEQNRIEVKGGTASRGKVRIYPREETEKKE